MNPIQAMASDHCAAKSRPAAFAPVSGLLSLKGRRTSPALPPMTPAHSHGASVWSIQMLWDHKKCRFTRFKLVNTEASFILHPLLLEKLPFLALSAASSVVTIRAHASLGALVSAEQLPVSYRLPPPPGGRSRARSCR